MTAPHEETQAGQPGDQRLDVVVVGGSQSGLAMAWHLAKQGLRFVVLEAAAELGHVWRSRWDSLKLFTPAQYDALPGMAFPAPADTYPTKDPVADYLRDYAKAFDLPVRLNARVTSLTRTDEGFEVRTADQTYRAREVVVATGPHFAAHTGTAPLEASSGQVIRHRLSRAGDRKLNHVLYMMAMVQVRRPSAGQAYYQRKRAEGKSPKEALRCLKRRLSDAVYRCLVADQAERSAAMATS